MVRFRQGAYGDQSRLDASLIALSQSVIGRLGLNTHALKSYMLTGNGIPQSEQALMGFLEKTRLCSQNA